MNIYNTNLTLGARVKLPVHPADPKTKFHTGTIARAGHRGVRGGTGFRVDWDNDNPMGAPRHFGAFLRPDCASQSFGLSLL